MEIVNKQFWQNYEKVCSQKHIFPTNIKFLSKVLITIISRTTGANPVYGKTVQFYFESVLLLIKYLCHINMTNQFIIAICFYIHGI